MKKLLPFLFISTFMFLILLPGIVNADPIDVISQSKFVFNDVEPEHWAKPDIEHLVSLGIIGGYPDGSFGPSEDITRGQVAAIINRDLKLPLATPNFNDIGTEYWAYGDIGSVSAKGIINGYTDGSYKPNASITREELASILVRAYGLTGTSTLSQTFNDVPDHAWSYDTVQALVSYGVTSGYSDGTFKPKNTVTRAEFASFMTRTLSAAKNGALSPDDLKALIAQIAEAKRKAEAAILAAVVMPLNVPLINQLNGHYMLNGCEVASLAMVLNYHGINVTKTELFNKVAKVPWKDANGIMGNPNDGFVGDMEKGPGLSVYHGPITDLAKQYVGDRAVDLTGNNFNDVLAYVKQGLPVWVIVNSKYQRTNDFKTWHTSSGQISVTYSLHSVVITGFDDNYVYVNNPFGTKNQKLARQKFESGWKQLGSQAVVLLR